MYITNRPSIAKIADDSGVDRIFVDMEYIGKDERQARLDTVKSHHSIDDIKRVRDVVQRAEVLVRVNPIHDESFQYTSSEEEIDNAIKAGADVLMLPMYKSISEVNRFVNAVNSRSKIMVLAETPDSIRIMDEVFRIQMVEEIHLGLNDLHLSLHRKFMFELLADGTVENLCKNIGRFRKKYGFGGIARIGYGLLPAEYIIREHYRLGSTISILSRSFCNINMMDNEKEIERLFQVELKRIRETEAEAERMSFEELERNKGVVAQLVKTIVEGL